MKPMRNKPAANNENGFTLAEVLIAITILAVGMLAIASMQVTGIQGNYTAAGLSSAAEWAAERAETLMTLPYSHADLSGAAAPGTPHGPVFDPDNRYQISWNVINDSPITNVKTINISVSWTDRGNNKSMTLVCYKPDII
jgi:prepilin-type N-terminal cleavage/methylation domain-containing protein